MVDWNAAPVRLGPGTAPVGVAPGTDATSKAVIGIRMTLLEGVASILHAYVILSETKNLLARGI